MKKYFKTKKSPHLLLKYFIYIIIVYFLSNTIFNSISHDFLFLENPIHNFSIDRNNILLKMGLNFKEKKKQPESNFVFSEEIIKPTIYLYTTHQSEEYNDYTVLEASLLLKDYLENNNIDVIMDDVNIANIIHENNLAYKDSYKITRELILKQDLRKIDIFIDLHRDSSIKKITTANINDRNYAKIMFVVGGKHNTYMNNYHLMDNLNKLIKNINPDLSRGIYLRKTSSYNQDLGSNIILIELGGVENTKEEVINSVKILSDVLTNYLNE